jgi:hypothetical protein
MPKPRFGDGGVILAQLLPEGGLAQFVREEFFFRKKEPKTIS